MSESARSRLLAPPRLRALDAPEEERRATWLELFFDLVLVVAVAQLHERPERRTGAAEAVEALVP